MRAWNSALLLQQQEWCKLSNQCNTQCIGYTSVIISEWHRRTVNKKYRPAVQALADVPQTGRPRSGRARTFQVNSRLHSEHVVVVDGRVRAAARRLPRPVQATLRHEFCKPSMSLPQSPLPRPRRAGTPSNLERMPACMHGNPRARCKCGPSALCLSDPSCAAAGMRAWLRHTARCTLYTQRKCMQADAHPLSPSACPAMSTAGGTRCTSMSFYNEYACWHGHVLERTGWRPCVM